MAAKANILILTSPPWNTRFERRHRRFSIHAVAWQGAASAPAVWLPGAARSGGPVGGEGSTEAVTSYTWQTALPEVVLVTRIWGHKTHPRPTSAATSNDQQWSST